MKDPTPIPTGGGSYAAIDGQLVPIGEDGKPLDAAADAPKAEPAPAGARRPLLPPTKTKP